MVMDARGVGALASRWGLRGGLAMLWGVTGWLWLGAICGATAASSDNGMNVMLMTLSAIGVTVLFWPEVRPLRFGR
jgi:hypothetical protein